MDPKLKACPFCNGGAALTNRHASFDHGNIAWVECRSCQCKTMTFLELEGAAEKAVSAWNRRVTDGQ